MSLPEFGFDEAAPYFRIVSGSSRNPSGLGGGSSGQEQEEPRMSSTYQQLLGREEGSYCWYRLEGSRADDGERGEGKTAQESNSSHLEKKRALFLAQSRQWMEKYVSTVEKPSASIYSIATASTRDHDDKEMRPVSTEETSHASLRQTCTGAGQDLRKLERQKHEKQEIEAEGAGDESRRAIIRRTLKKFQQLYELYESEPEETGPQKRRKSRNSPMRAAAHMREKGWTLDEDIIGEVEGVEVGDAFKFRAEMSVIGLHKELIMGINVVKRPDSGGGAIATSVVFGIGGSYADNIYREKGLAQPIVYSGEGGFPFGARSSTKEARVYKDQTLTPGNAALIRSFEQKIPIRVVKKRTGDDKKYVYDGLYEIVDYKFEQGVHGNKVYKFMLSRLD